MNADERHSKIYEDEIDLSKYLEVIWKRRVIILSVTLVCALLAGMMSFLIPKAYRAEALLRIGNVGSIGSIGNIGNIGSIGSIGNIGNIGSIGSIGNIGSTAIEDGATVAELIKSRSFLSTVIEKNFKIWGRNLDPNELSVKSTFEKDARGGKGTQIIKIQAEGRSPQQAVETVNAIANEVIIRHKVKFDSATSLLRKMEEDLAIEISASEKQIEALKNTITKIEKDPKVDAPAVILLRANLNDRENLLAHSKQRMGNIKLARSPLFTENTNITDPPAIPKKPVKPRRVIIVLIGAFIGLMLSIFWALAAESLDSKKANQKEL